MQLLPTIFMQVFLCLSANRRTAWIASRDDGADLASSILPMAPEVSYQSEKAIVGRQLLIRHANRFEARFQIIRRPSRVIRNHQIEKSQGRVWKLFASIGVV